MTWEQVGQTVAWIGLIATAFSVGVAGIRALIRGPKEDRAVETELQDRITAMADRWLVRAEDRLEVTEKKALAADQRAEAAEQRVTDLTERVVGLERNLFSALDTISVIWPWGLAGAPHPPPTLPAWILEWLLHKQVLAEQELKDRPEIDWKKGGLAD